MDEFIWLDATAQAELVRKREVKPLELVDAAIARVEKLNPQINAVVTPMYEEARELAQSPLPLPLGTLDSAVDNPLKGFYRASQFMPFTPIFNATGQPTMSVPLYWNDAGLPIGVHFAGRFGDEATLFRLAAQLGQAQPWQDRYPAISG